MNMNECKVHQYQHFPSASRCARRMVLFEINHHTIFKYDSVFTFF